MIVICYGQYPAVLNPERILAQVVSTPPALVIEDWQAVARVPERAAQHVCSAAQLVPVPVEVAVEVGVTVEVAVEVAVPVEGVQIPLTAYDETSWAHWASV